MFVLERDKDASGISGTGIVAEGIVFSDGTTVVRWCSQHQKPTTVVHESIQSVISLHGHSGSTRVVWSEPT
jgi:hypothetical protein